MSIRIIVCVRQIIDPLTPASEFKVDPARKRAVLPPGRKLVISDYDEVAVEAALRIKDTRGAEVTALSLGDGSAKEALRRCLAMGADKGVLLCDPAFDDADSLATARALAQAIKKLGEFDLVLCGRQEGDWDAGQVGSGTAALLGIPVVSVVGRIDIGDNGSAVVERIVADGRDVIEMPLPALLTVSSEIGEPRYPPVRRVLADAR
ncbi:MAG: electron transfer flavoprotein subunit beta/FixA family protein [Chloroflexota bacterium]